MELDHDAPAALNAVAMEVANTHRVDEAIPRHELLDPAIELLERNGQLVEPGGPAHDLERGARRIYCGD